jgi:hypothetical protein
MSPGKGSKQEVIRRFEKNVKKVRLTVDGCKFRFGYTVREFAQANKIQPKEALMRFGQIRNKRKNYSGKKSFKCSAPR